MTFKSGEDPAQNTTATEAYERVFAYRFKMYIEKRGFAGTGNLIVRHADFDKIGPFLGIQFEEDTDWGHRARAAGYSLRYVPDLIVYHSPRSYDELVTKWDRHTLHLFNNMRKKPLWQILWIASSFALLASPFIHGWKFLTTNRIHGAGLRWKSFLVLFRIRAHRAFNRLALLRSTKNIVWNR